MQEAPSEAADSTSTVDQGRMLRAPEACQKVNVSISGLYALIKKAGFPPPVKLGPRMSRWPERKIDAWLAERIESNARPGRS